MLVLLLIKYSIELKRHLQNKVLRHSIELQFGHMTDIETKFHTIGEKKLREIVNNALWARGT